MLPAERYTVGFALRRSYLGAGAAGIIALVLALGAVLDLFDADVAVEGTIVLALIVGAFYALLRSGYSQRFADPSLMSAQLAVALLYLGYLTFRTGDTPAAIALLYALVMLYGVLRLDAARLAWLSGLAIVAHGVALFMLIDRGERLDHPAAWTQFGALVLTLFGFAFASQAVMRLRERLAEYGARELEAAAAARERASRDELTGTYNRKHLFEALEREVSRAERTGRPLSVARIDIDNLRFVNEHYGFGAGDDVLRHFAQVALRVVRDVDVFGRSGGREFLLVMPDTDLAGATLAGERLRAGVRKDRFPHVGEGRITFSAGLVQRAKNESAFDLAARAEASLNYAKAAGRDRVVAAAR